MPGRENSMRMGREGSVAWETQKFIFSHCRGEGWGGQQPPAQTIAGVHPNLPAVFSVDSQRQASWWSVGPVCRDGTFQKASAALGYSLFGMQGHLFNLYLTDIKTHRHYQYQQGATGCFHERVFRSILLTCCCLE